MKFYFSGCSFSWGTGLDDKKDRWTKLVSDHFGAEEHNIACGGGSNDRMIRRLMLDDDSEDYNIYFMQLTLPSRTEFFDDTFKKWRTIHPLKTFGKSKKEWKNIYYPSIESYYKKLYNKTYGDTNEQVVYKSINAYLSHKPIVWSTLRSARYHNSDEGTSTVPVDICIGKPYPFLPCGHPTIEGHRMIADEMISIVKKRGIL